MVSDIDRTGLLRTVLKSINGIIRSLSKLERDPPIVEMAHFQMQGLFSKNGLGPMEKELFQILSKVNLYRSFYWKLQGSITQSFLRLLKVKGYLPSYSLEVESLKNALPESVIKGDERIWIYSYDHYITAISDKVGRKKEGAPGGDEVFKTISYKYSKQVGDLERSVNDLLPSLHVLKGKVHAKLKEPDRPWDDIKVKTPKIEVVKRPIRKSIVIKKPIPLPKKKIPRKKVLKKPEIHVIGPEGLE